MKYFWDRGLAPADRRRRFMQMDVCGAPAADTLARLFWSLRRDAAEDADVSPLLAAPLDGEHAGRYLRDATEAGMLLRMPDVNARPHAPEVVGRVQAIMQQMGCGHCHESLTYSDCKGCAT